MITMESKRTFLILETLRSKHFYLTTLVWFVVAVVFGRDKYAVLTVIMDNDIIFE